MSKASEAHGSGKQSTSSADAKQEKDSAYIAWISRRDDSINAYDLRSIEKRGSIGGMVVA